MKGTFSHHIIFAMVMDDPGLCKELIERILPDKKVKEVRITEHPKVLPEATLLTGPEGKSIRMDIFFEDGEKGGRLQRLKAQLCHLYLLL